jgi:soluble lytic murein transglycosylase-like protein
MATSDSRCRAADAASARRAGQGPRSQACGWAAGIAALMLPALLLISGHAGATTPPPPPTLDGLPRPATPPRETGPVVPAQVQRWRTEALAYEHGDGVPRDPLRAAELYCRAARHGDAEAQFSLAWMLTNSRGIERNDAQAAHLFAAAAEQGLAQAQNMAASMGTPIGPPPPCLQQPAADLPAPLPAMAQRAMPARGVAASPPAKTAPLLPANAPPQIVNFVKLVAPDYKLEPAFVLAIMATESNFDPLAVSPRKAQGLMQLIPDTAARFAVRDPLDPVQNIRGGMAYLRWLMAFFEGDVVLVAAAYNAGERAVERYRGVPPYAETRHYVRKILAAMGNQVSHPFDPKVTAPSPVLPAMREAPRPRS